MAVELLFLSIILRKQALTGLALPVHETAMRLFRWEPDWFREDAHLLATTFMSPFDTRRFGKVLEARTGLKRGLDWAVADMATGPTFQVAWLEWQNQQQENPLAWDHRTARGELARVPAMMPGVLPEVTCRARVCKLFGRDSGHDDHNHREDFGRFLPDWGGRDLWLFSDPEAPVGPHDTLRWASVNLNHIDFSTY